MSAVERTIYHEMAETLDNLSLIVTTVARSRGLSMRDVAAQSGVLSSTLSRLHHGKGLSTENAIGLLRWLDTPTPTEGAPMSDDTESTETVMNETPEPADQELRTEIKHALNRASAENASGTPDHILADYLMACLAAFDAATEERANWRDESVELPALQHLKAAR